jgi:hypothetical protein
MVDVNGHELQSYTRAEFEELRERLADCDLIGAVNARPVLEALGVDPGSRRLAELGPPQKPRTRNRAGRKLQITFDLIVRGSRGISLIGDRWPPCGNAARRRYLIRPAPDH